MSAHVLLNLRKRQNAWLANKKLRIIGLIIPTNLL